MPQFNFWEFLAGLGIFLLGMLMIEAALEFLAGRSFKRFLRRNTSNPIKAILSGTTVTALLQSSSVVSLMVLAFVGAGVIELYNAIGIILGSNLGTTFTGWIVAYFGFEFDIESFALPFIGIGGLTMVFFSKQERLQQFGKLLVGFGFIFMGLDFMKSSMEVISKTFDLSPFAHYSPYLLFVIGFVLTAIIQSSSASMVIALSALHTGIIPLESAAAMVIGNDLGTTITVLLGGMKGSPSKKRVALSHFLFNLIVDLLALALLFPLIYFITKVLHFTNPLLSLVAFHSIFNLLGIILFLPFLKWFAAFLEKRFVSRDNFVARYITQVPPEVPEIAIETLKKEIKHLIKRVLAYHLSVLGIEQEKLERAYWIDGQFGDVGQLFYQTIKELEGEMVEFFVDVQNNKLTTEESVNLKQINSSIRYAMTAAKSLKDTSHNFKEFQRSVNNEIEELVELIKVQQLEIYDGLLQVLAMRRPENHFEALADIKKMSKEHYNHFLDVAYKLVRKDKFTDIEISTIFNVNREIHNANKSLVHSVKDLILTFVQAGDFDAIS